MSDERLISIDRIWARVRGRLRQEFGESTYRSWIRSLVLEEVFNKRVTLAAPTLFMRDRIVAQYGDRITSAWTAESADTINDCVITVRSSDELVSETATGDPLKTKNFVSVEPKVIGTKTKSANSIEGSLDSRFTFDNFVVGKPNELAYAAAQRVSGSDEVLFNPLFLYGAVGLGKTHLMHSIAWDIRLRDPSRRVLYLSAEKFMYQFIRALRFKDTMAFKDQFRSVDVLMIDDVQFIGGKDSTQEEFFHTFNALVDQNRQVIISADKSPTDLEGLEERLRSRLGWGLVADIHPTTYELRLGILQSKVEKLGVAVPTKVLEFLAHKITSNVRELEGAMNRIAAHATLVGRDITLEATQEVLHDLLRSYERRVTIEEIQRQVASHYQIRVGDMHSARRSRSIARPRQIAMFLAKQLTQHSLPDIGRRFGGRDHTTVLHAVKKIDELCLIDKQFQDDVEFLRRMLET
ncbi:MAG: chromosomal replication initiator protein DnaA [Thalassobaculaceae bacterium]